VTRFRLEFVWEDQATCAAVLEGWQALLSGRETPGGLVKRVAAHEQFGVTAGTMRVLGAESP